MKKTYEELDKMTRKELRDYIMITLNQVIPSNLSKCELRLMVYTQIGVRA